MRPEGPENMSRLAHVTSGGSVVVASGWLAGESQNPMAYRRSSREMLVNNWSMRLRLPVRIISSRGSCTVLAIRLERISRSLTNQRRVRLSTRGTTAYAIAASASISGTMNRRESRMTGRLDECYRDRDGDEGEPYLKLAFWPDPATDWLIAIMLRVNRAPATRHSAWPLRDPLSARRRRNGRDLQSARFQVGARRSREDPTRNPRKATRNGSSALSKRRAPWRR